MALVSTDYNGTNRAIEVATTGDNKVDFLASGATLKTVTLSYTNATGGSITTGSVIDLGTIPAGKVLPQSWLATTDFGSTTTLDLGWQEYEGSTALVAADTDGFVDGLDVSGQATSDLIGNYTAGSGNDATQGWDFTGPTQVLATVVGTMQAGADIYATFLIATA